MKQHNNVRWIWAILFIFTIIAFISNVIIYAQSSENYEIKKSAITQGGVSSQSNNYHNVDAIGQSSAIGTSSSENYTVSAGFLSENEQVVTDVYRKFSSTLPNKFRLFQNYPNPFNPVTNIEYHLPRTAEVKLIVYDIKGHVVRQFSIGSVSAGSYTVVWDGKDSAGKTVASGMYFYRINMKSVDADQQSYVDVKKMILMK